MRDIKFRVWDKETKHMHICGEDVHDTINFEIETNRAYYYNLQNGCGSLREDSDYVLMQYTGLKDKNGKEIYEGDIVRLGTYTKGVVEYSDEYAQFIIINTNTIEYEYEPLADYTKIEIIGNKWDNPELLKNT